MSVIVVVVTVVVTVVVAVIVLVVVAGRDLLDLILTSSTLQTFGNVMNRVRVWIIQFYQVQ